MRIWICLDRESDAGYIKYQKILYSGCEKLISIYNYLKMYQIFRQTKCYWFHLHQINILGKSNFYGGGF